MSYVFKSNSMYARVAVEVSILAMTKIVFPHHPNILFFVTSLDYVKDNAEIYSKINNLMKDNVYAS